MVINGYKLFTAAPIKNMIGLKERSDNGVSHGLAEVGYDIRLKQGIHFKPTTYHHMGQPVGGPMCMIDGQKPQMGNFCLASAMEEFQMPNFLMGIVHDKSTWARKGLSVFNTVIEPGWKGFLTLELVFHGSEGIYIPPGTGIAQVVFHQITDAVTYAGPYQNQPDNPTGSIVT